LLEGQLDIASDRAAADFFGAAVRRFHNARAAAGHNREPEARNGRAHFSSELVMGIVLFDSRRTEDGYARADEVEGAKSTQKIAHHSQQGEKFG
jgi:hypothetical protein